MFIFIILSYCLIAGRRTSIIFNIQDIVLMIHDHYDYDGFLARNMRDILVKVELNQNST